MSAPSGYSEMFEWWDGNPQGEDRAGLTVVLTDGKVIPANRAPFDIDPSDVIGVVGGDNTSVAIITHGSPSEWHLKHLRDSANRLLWEKQVMVEWVDKGFRHWYEADRIPDGIVAPADAVYHTINPQTKYPLIREILSEEYKNPGKPVEPYLPRWERKEWALVVLLGRVIVRDNSVCNGRWKKLSAAPGQLGGKSVSEWLVR